MKKILVLIFVLLSIVAVEAQSSITFYTSNVESLFRKAKQENKHIFVDTYTTWCKPCKKMNRVFAEPAVASYYNGNFINIKVNMDNIHSKDAKFIKSNYQVVFMPTMLILDPNGNQLYKVDRLVSGDELLKAGDRALHPEKYRRAIPQRYTRREVVKTTTAPPVTKRTYASNVVKRKPAPTAPSTGPTNSPGTIRSHTGATIRATNVSTQANKSKTVSAGVQKAKGLKRKTPIKEYKQEQEKSNEKIVKMVDNDHLAEDPNLLREEAYYCLTRMDGSHIQAADRYLSTQKDWSTKENMQFLMDFTENTDTKSFNYIADNKDKFVKEFGKNKVERLLSVAVYKRLHYGVPRATKKDAIKLYEYIQVHNPKVFAYHYYLPMLMHDNNKKLVMKESKDYFKKYPSDSTLAKRFVTYATNDLNDFSKKDISFIKNMAERLADQKKDQIDHKNNLLKLYIATNNCVKAKALASSMEETELTLQAINCK